ncbi:MAG: HD domain-containing protein [Desulfomonile tiedjei]|uniref:HD domain-containing protein n=1 Tax=Desulfomonile tiedjei TaxID=2358 RepID=A0A9D6YZD4_9BACT|nr:HD domain-containing protein [Desulfomonile tiedjei]
MGNRLRSELMVEKDPLFKDRVAVEMRKYFNTDSRRIDHASRVALYAEKLAVEENGDPAVVIPTAYLHDIGIKEAERKHKSTAARYQHEEGPPIAREIMEKLAATEELITEVCDIVGHHHNPRPHESINFKVLYDADLIVNIEDNLRENKISAEAVRKLVTKRFLTLSGQKMAVAMFIPSKKEV